MNTAELVLHADAVASLEAFLAAPAHATLISGPAGTGKTIVADLLAKELLGVSSLENQPYYRAVAPAKNSIAIEKIRELIQFFRLSVPGKAAVKRVAVVQDADTMSREAQNALLKLLEEPPEGSVLILTTSNVQALLPTIRSRVQIIMLPTPTTEALEAHFVASGHTDSSIQRAVLRHGDNIAAIHISLNGADDADDTSVDLVRQTLAGSTYERLLVVDSLAKQKEAALEFVDTLAQVASVSIGSAAAKQGNIQRWYSVLAAAQTAGAALERSGNAKLVLTELMLSI